MLVTVYTVALLRPYAPWQSTQICCAVFEHEAGEEVPIVFAGLDELEPRVAAGTAFFVLGGAHDADRSGKG